MNDKNKILNISSDSKTVKCCSCDKINCLRREFDGCEECEIKAGFWLQMLNRLFKPPSPYMECFVGGFME